MERGGGSVCVCGGVSPLPPSDSVKVVLLPSDAWGSSSEMTFIDWV